MGKRLAGFVLAVCVALAFVEAPDAGAARTENSAAFVGTYKVTVKAPSRRIGTWSLYDYGSFVRSDGVSGTWSNKGTTITLRVNAGDTQLRFVGRTTRAGIGTRYHPGTLYVNGTKSGTWFAVKSSSAVSGTIAGHYEWEVYFDGKSWEGFDMWLYRNHTGADFYGDTITWTRSYKMITVRRVTSSNVEVDYTGTINRSGICSQQKPCTATYSNGGSGPWYGWRVPPP